MKSSSLRQELRRVDSLRPRPNNEKQHTEAQIQHLVASITEFGFNDPIGILPNGEIVEGMGRWEAVKRLGWEEVPVLVQEHLTSVEAKAYGVAHNQMTLLTGLNTDNVLAEFARLGVGAEDHEAIGFASDEVTFLMPEQRDILEDETLTSTVADASEWRDLVAPAIKTTLSFADEVQQARFEQLISALRERYPHEPTLADRFTRFIEEFNQNG